MPETLEDKLVVGLSSRALFDLDEANAVFEQHGLSAFREYQREHEREILEPGTAFPLVKGLLAVNERAGDQLVEVIILSRNDADSAMRVLRSIEAHGLPITRGVFRGGRDPWPLLPALSCDVFLSAESSQVLKAREHGVAAALILPGARLANEDVGEVRIAFDGDAVLFDATSQKVYDEQGLDAFHEHEAAHQDEPMSPGPFRPFLDGLARIQARFGATSPVRTALVTARAAPAHYRVVNTLRAWGINIDETYFLGGVDKTKVLKAFGAHIFFDDQLSHAERASAQVPAAQVLWFEDELPAPAEQAKPAVVKAKGKRTSRPTAKRAKPAASPRGGGRRAAPGARARSER
ncbi:MAG: 5'-nucleotidase [Candidatus Limnocylindrales bacterium]